MEQTAKHKNPSRKVCEEQIKRILMTEVLEKGINHQFKTAADFMKYFESLYPAGPGLTKQVQRAVKSLDMPKDSDGYFIINKTKEQIHQEDALSQALKQTSAEIQEMDQPLEVLFLRTEASYRSYLLELIQNSETFRGKYVTAMNTTDGILFYTTTKHQLKMLLQSLIEK
ncbi:hypothetical protein SAMN02910453_0930 [Lachnospiraceae bacterium A10]|nr:hypothetical protein SAMN02910453_0930 [Lachnospiraceae bacterium A10]